MAEGSEAGNINSTTKDNEDFSENPSIGGGAPSGTGTKSWLHANAGSVKFDIKPYDGTVSFNIWQRRMKGLLTHQRLQWALYGIENKPADMTDVEWEDIDSRAMTSIEMSITDEVLNRVIEEKSAKGMWDKLQEIYLNDSMSQKLFLLKRLFKLEMKEGADVMKHISAFNSLINDLARLDESFSEHLKACCLLGSLPDSFDNFSNTLMFAKPNLTLKDVTQGLQQHVTMKKKTGSGKDSSHGEGLFAKGVDDRPGRSQSRGRFNKNRNRSKSRPRRDVECWGCKEKGHIQKYCPKAKKEDDKKPTASVASVKSDSDGETVDGEILAAFAHDSTDGWILDSGCSYHMSPNYSWFVDYKSVSEGLISMGNDATCKVVGVGSVRIKMWDGSTRTLTDVRHVPSLKKNLISLGMLESNGCVFQSDKGGLKVTKGSLVVMRGVRVKNNLYKLRGETVIGGAAVATTNISEDDDTKLWHMRLGHMSQTGMQVLCKRNLLKGVHSCQVDFCKYCVMGKQTRVRFSKGKSRSTGILDYVHSDVNGPSDTQSFGGFRYFVSFIDDFSRKVWIYLLKEKSEVFTKFQEWKKMVETQTGKKIKYLRTDNGGEYKSEEFLEFCRQEGITRHFTVKKTPQQNGVSERMNRTVMERARCMRLHAGLPKAFWAYAVDHACYLVNRSPNTFLENRCAEEVWHEREVDYSGLKVFGCVAYAHIPADERSKNDSKSLPCIFLGYGKGVKGFKLWNPVNRKFLFSRDVVFDEGSLVKVRETEVIQEDGGVRSIQLLAPHVSDSALERVTESESVAIDAEQQGTDFVEVEHYMDDEETPVRVEHTPPPTTNVPEHSIALDRPKRGPKPINRYGEWDDEVNYALLSEDGDPCTYREAIACENRSHWLEAMQEEMESIRRNSVWELVPKPHNRSLVGSKWVFRKKESGSKEESPKYKARLVAKGFSQKEGVDYDEIFSPVVKHTSIRVLLALVAQFNLELEQMDVKTAFLHGELTETIYMAQPEGFTIAGKEDLVCKLKKSLYGLKQSPRQWYLRFDSFMLRIGYSRSQEDHCVYYRLYDDGDFVLLTLYVDDMLIACRSMSKIRELKAELSSEFEMKDLGSATKILGMEIQRDRKIGTVQLSQKSYIQKVLKQFGMESPKPVSTPLALHFSLSALQCPSTKEEEDEMRTIPYASAVGCLMYAMVCTRPDIAQAVSVVSRYMAKPGKEHWRAVKWILRYLKGTQKLGLQYQKCEQGDRVKGFCDSDYAGDRDKARSTSGFVFTLAGGPVSWRSVLQNPPALSTTEAEYMALTESSKDAVWLRKLVSKLGFKQGPVEVLCDSASAIALVNNPVYHARTKHIAPKYHRIRFWVEEGKVRIVKVDTKENAADMLTKSLPTEKFRYCLELLNLISC